jgi:hypothetical protein
MTVSGRGWGCRCFRQSFGDRKYGVELGRKKMIEPEKLNQLETDTRWGIRSFEVWHGDITKLNFPINFLLIAQPGRYPTYSLHRSL